MIPARAIAATYHESCRHSHVKGIRNKVFPLHSCWLLDFAASLENITDNSPHNLLNDGLTAAAQSHHMLIAGGSVIRCLAKAGSRGYVNATHYIKIGAGDVDESAGTMTIPAAARLTLRTKLGFSAGDLGVGLFYQATLQYLFFFYTDVVGISPAKVAMIFVIARCADVTVCPLIGAMADRTRTRWGRFRPYLALGSVPLAIALIAVFTSIGGGENLKALFALVTYSLFSICYAVVTIPYTALMGAMTSDPHDRTQLGTYRSIFSFSASLIVSAAMLPIARSVGEAVGFQVAAGCVILLALPAIWVAFFSAREAISPAKDEKIEFRHMAAAVGTRPLMTMYAILILVNISVMLRSSGAVYFFKYNLGRPDLVSVYLTVVGVLLLVGIMVTPMIVRRIGKRSAMVAGTMLVVIGQIALSFVPTSVIGTFLCAGILPAFGTGFQVATIWPLFADSVDFAEWKRGKRVEGAALGVAIFSQKLSLALGGILSGWTLAISGYVANGAQSPTGLRGILALCAYYPAVAALICLGLACYYPLTEQKMQGLQSDLARRRLSRSAGQGALSGI
jgi:sugar (glycoside-pentoside-hexuronide) transporter